MLWLCLHLPLLPLEVFVRGSQPQPTVVVHRDRGRERILACNQAAENVGLRAGMRMSAARALALIDGKDFVLPEHVKEVLPAVVNHRLVANSDELSSKNMTAAEYIAESVPIP